MTKARRARNTKDKILINNKMVVRVHQIQEILIKNCTKCNNHKEGRIYSISYYTRTINETKMKLSKLKICVH